MTRLSADRALPLVRRRITYNRFRVIKPLRAMRSSSSLANRSRCTEPDRRAQRRHICTLSVFEERSGYRKAEFMADNSSAAPECAEATIDYLGRESVDALFATATGLFNRVPAANHVSICLSLLSRRSIFPFGIDRLIGRGTNCRVASRFKWRSGLFATKITRAMSWRAVGGNGLTRARTNRNNYEIDSTIWSVMVT